MPLDAMDKIKTLIVTQADPFYLPLFFKQFFKRLEECKGRVEVDGVIVQRALGNRTILSLAKCVVGLYGFWGTIAKTLEFSLLKLADLGCWVGIPVMPNGIGMITRRYGCRLLPFVDVNDQRLVAYVKEHNIDLIISVSASQIFHGDILAAPPMGCVNLHNGDLPRYRGMLPNFWQMHNGEERSVLTIHTMAQELDEGKIILQRSTPIGKGMPLDKLIKDTKISSADTLVEWLAGMDKKRLFATSAMDKSQECYYSFPTWRDVKEFKRRGYRVI
jgi:methionyl-tRNA formyltransferase